jgi:hypothetical protein
MTISLESQQAYPSKFGFAKDPVDNHPKTCPECGEVEHECGVCGKSITVDKCQGNGGICDDCLVEEDFQNKFGK